MNILLFVLVLFTHFLFEERGSGARVVTPWPHPWKNVKPGTAVTSFMSYRMYEYPVPTQQGS